MDGNNNNQPITPAEPTQPAQPTEPVTPAEPEPQPQMQFQGTPSVAPQPGQTIPVQDVPTVHGDPQTDETKAKRMMSYFRTCAGIIAVASIFSFTTMSIDGGTCSSLDSVSNGLCGDFKSTLLIKNGIFAVAAVLSAASIILILMRKRIAKTLVPIMAIVTAIASIILFFVIQNLINTIASATSAGYADLVFGDIRVEYIICMVGAILYASVWAPYFLISKRAAAYLDK